MTALGESEQRSALPDRIFKLVALLAGVCLLGFIVFVVVRGSSPSDRVPGSSALAVPPPTLLQTGTVAPAFSLPRLDGGAPVSLAGYRGTPVILNFFASWCPHCRAELEAVATVARKTEGRVAVVGVDTNDTASAAARLLAAAHATYPVAVDAHAKVASSYLLTALPVTYFVSAEGRVVGYALGSETVASLERWVKRLSEPTQ
jgi:cytochrome c biogenesis protein CcmG, thiol:disulfide interchange protein DsbE